MLVLKASVANLNKLNGYNFDNRYVGNKKGDVFLIKEDNGLNFECDSMNPFITKNGYVEYVLTTKDGTKKHLQAQRIVAGLFLPNPKKLPEVNHKDGKRANNILSNLEWCTHQDNVIHSFKKLGKVIWNKNLKIKK